MQITIKGKQKEIADFVRAIQSQQHRHEQSSVCLDRSKPITNPLTKD